MSALSKIAEFSSKQLSGPPNNPNNITRYAGGVQNIHPFISGYWVIQLNTIPEVLYGSEHGKNFKTWIRSTAEGFTPPSRTQNKVDIPGMGGLGSSFITGQTLTRTFTTTHREYTGLKILNGINVWGNAIDSAFGVHSNRTNDSFTSLDYKGTCYVGFLKPTVKSDGVIDAVDFEEVFYFDGVWPETIPYDALSQDISTNDSIQLSITWNFDGWPETLSTNSELSTKLADLLGSYKSIFPNAQAE